MQLKYNEFKNKLLGCWMGKNIGGTLGAPFEGKRGLLDVNFYTQDIDGKPLPNDDLDLQLVWLNAVEQHGRALNASILSEYWIHHITPNWSEYGAAKANLRMGLVPPLSGYVNNLHRNSCGAFIRSEIWACIAPGHPEIAAQYAYEDAIVDHSHEGVYGEVFCAALQSAAFIESDKYKLIDIGLSYIPEDCGIAKGIKEVINAYNEKVDWKEAYRRAMNTVPGTFSAHVKCMEMLGTEFPLGEYGWDTPVNIAITILGWLYGEDDFGKSLCIAVNCGEDTDCTAATLGAIIGIIKGVDRLPQEWIKPIGNSIATICIDASDCTITIPKTIDELTERILAVVPQFMGSSLCSLLHDDCGYAVDTLEKDKLYKRENKRNIWVVEKLGDVKEYQPFQVKYSHSMFDVILDYMGEPFIQEGKPKKFKLSFMSKKGRQDWVRIKWHNPAGWKVTPSEETSFLLYQFYHSYSEIEFTVEADTLDKAKYEMLIEISVEGHLAKTVIPVVLLNSYGTYVQEIKQ